MTQFTCKGVKQINNRISLNMTFIFTIRISRHFSSTREFQMGNFQKYWSQNVGQDFIVLDFFHGRKILKVDGRDGRGPQNRKKNAPAGRFTCMGYSVFYFIYFLYMSVSRWSVLCDWVWRAGRRPHRFPHNNFSSVYRIFTKLGHMIPLWKGKNPIYFGVIRSKVKVTVTINIIFDNRVVSAR